jgi:hypothetical protein
VSHDSSTPRVFPKRSPEPADVTAVRAIILIWTRQADGLWHSSRNPDVAYPWDRLSAIFKLTEVLEVPAVWAPTFEDVFGARQTSVTRS